MTTPLDRGARAKTVPEVRQSRYADYLIGLGLLWLGSLAVFHSTIGGVSTGLAWLVAIGAGAVVLGVGVTLFLKRFRS